MMSEEWVEEQKEELTDERILQLLEERQYKELKEELENNMYPADLADILEGFEQKQMVMVFRLLAKEEAAETFAYMNSDLRELLINSLTDSELEEVMEEMYLDDTVERLRYIDGKSDWIDLRSAAEVVMAAGEFTMIPLGVALQLPEGYEAHIVPRSSTFKNFGIIQTNHTGVVDNSYCGPDDWWYMPAYALRDTVIHKNDRICQFRIVKNQPALVFDEVVALEGKNRGGLGSTGVK